MGKYEINIVLLLLVFWCIPWWIYNCFIRTKDFHPMGTEVLPTPKWISCGIPYVSIDPKKNVCENVKFDGWTIGHILIYFTIGMVLPGYWRQIFLLSIACEIFEYIVGWRARWLMDPLTNMFGYLLGHLIIINLRNWSFLNTNQTTYTLVLMLGLLLFMNRPCMMANDFY